MLLASSLGRCLFALCLAALAARGARAHDVSPAQILAQLSSRAARDAYGVAEASRHPELARLLIVRVGTKWHALPAERRRLLAEEWAGAWRHAVEQGIVSIVDAEDGRSVVSFDALGNARPSPP